MGTWLDAAILTAWNKDDAGLRSKIDHLVEDWLKTQGDDGYIGTYFPEDHWKSWDIWIHAHDIIGLLSYYHSARFLCYPRFDHSTSADVRPGLGGCDAVV